MRSACVAVLCASFIATLGSFGAAQEPKPKQPDAARFSLIGSWKGTFNVKGFVTFEVRTTFRKDGTYTTTSISNVPTVTTESGTYTYQFQSENFGVLTAKPSADGFSIETTAKITWNGPSQFVYEGAGLRITMNRTGVPSGSIGLTEEPAPVALAPQESKDTKVDPTSRPPRVRSLSPDSLPQFLDNMGYDYKLVKLPSGGTLCTVTIHQDTWRFYVEVGLSSNEQYLWLMASLGELPEQSRLPAEPLLRLLEENWLTYPNQFAAHKEYRRLYLHRALENHDITPALFREAMDQFVGTIRRTHPLWDTAKWGETARRDVPPDGGKKVPDGGKKTPDGGPPPTYPDTLQGLTRLFKDLLALARAGQRDQLTARVKEFILPNHDAWFKKIFGAENGARASAEYGQALAENQAWLVRALLTAAEEGQTEVQVERFTKPDPEYAAGNQNRALELMKVKVPLNSVVLVKPGEETGLHLYSFVYVDGAFRCAGKMRALAAGGFGWQPRNGQVITAAAVWPIVEWLPMPLQEDEITHQLTTAVRPTSPPATRAPAGVTGPVAPTPHPLSGGQAEVGWNVLPPLIRSPQLATPLRWQESVGRNVINGAVWQQVHPLRSAPLSPGLSAVQGLQPEVQLNRIEPIRLENFIPASVTRALAAPAETTPLEAREFQNLQPRPQSPRP